MCQVIAKCLVVLGLGIFLIPSQVALAAELSCNDENPVVATVSVTNNVIAGTQVPITITIENSSSQPVTNVTVTLAIGRKDSSLVMDDYFAALRDISVQPNQSDTYVVEWPSSPFIASGTYTVSSFLSYPQATHELRSVSPAFTIISESSSALTILPATIFIGDTHYTLGQKYVSSLYKPTAVVFDIKNEFAYPINAQVNWSLYHDTVTTSNAMMVETSEMVSLAAGAVTSSQIKLPPLSPGRYVLQVEVRSGSASKFTHIHMEDVAAPPVITAVRASAYTLTDTATLSACVTEAAIGSTVVFSVLDGYGRTLTQQAHVVDRAGEVAVAATVPVALESYSIHAHIIDTAGFVVAGQVTDLTCAATNKNDCHEVSTWALWSTTLWYGTALLFGLIIGLYSFTRFMTHKTFMRSQRTLARHLMVSCAVVFVLWTSAPANSQAASVPALPSIPPLYVPPLPPVPPLFLPPLLIPVMPVIPSTPPPATIPIPIVPLSPTLVTPIQPPVATNAAPQAPDVTHAASVNVGVIVPITSQAIDPDGDALYYEVDWTMSGTANQRIPAAGTVPSDTAVTTSRAWATTGVKQFAVRAVDTSGAISPWTTTSLIITAPTAASVTLEAQSNTHPSWTASDIPASLGDTVRVRWNSSNADTCISPDFSTGGATQNLTGVIVATPAIGTAASFDITCTGSGLPGSDTITVTTNTLPLPVITLESMVDGVPGFDRMITAGQEVEAVWTASNASYCLGINLDTTSTLAADTADLTEPVAGATENYGVRCYNAVGDNVAKTFTITTHELVTLSFGASTNPTVVPAPVLSVIPSDTLYFTWSSTGATSCASSDYAVGGGATIAKTNLVVSPLPIAGTSKTYQLTCIGPGGSATNAIVVSTIDPVMPSASTAIDPTPSITAAKSIVRHDETTTLSYSVGTTDPMTCTISGPKLTPDYTFNPATDSPSGTLTTPTITADQRYVLTCEVPSGAVFSDFTDIQNVGSVEEI